LAPVKNLPNFDQSLALLGNALTLVTTATRASIIGAEGSG